MLRVDPIVRGQIDIMKHITWGHWESWTIWYQVYLLRGKHSDSLVKCPLFANLRHAIIVANDRKSETNRLQRRKWRELAQVVVHVFVQGRKVWG